MYCSVCGTHIETDSITTCPNCGAHLEKSPPSDTLPPLTEEKEPSLKNELPPPRRGASKKVLIAVLSILTLVLVVVLVSYVRYSQSITKDIDAFSTVVSSYKELREDYSLGSYKEDYESLLNQCNLCISNKETAMIPSLSDQIKEIKANIKQENKALDEYRAELTTFKNASTLYEIKGNDQTSYTTLISKFETAIDNSNLSDCKAVSKQLLEFTSKLDKTNGQTSAEDYKKQLEDLEKQLKKDSSSSQTNIYISPKNEPDTNDSDAAYAVTASADYIIPYSSSTYLTNSDLSGLSHWELTLARNEIYARHGRTFKNKDIQAYFNSKSWYYGSIAPSDFEEDTYFNSYEKKNVSTIKRYEENH